MRKKGGRITSAMDDMIDGLKVLVTGGAGFIGSNLILRLKEEGAHIRVSLHKQPLQIASDGIEIMYNDLRDLSACHEVVANIDIVIHCAANTSGAAVMATTPMVHVTPNVVMNANLLEAAYKNKVKKFVFISSGAAYPPTGRRPVTEDEMFDADPIDVYYPVAWMKRYTEILCRTYATKLQEPMSTLVIRPSNIFGPYDKFDFATSHVTSALIRRVVERQNPMDIWGTGDDVRDLIYVSDFLDGLFLAIETCDFYDEMNICSGKGVTIKDILNTTLEVDQFRDADVHFDPDKPSTIPIRLMDNSRAREQLGFEAKVTLAEGIRHVIQWYRENPFSG